MHFGRVSKTKLDSLDRLLMTMIRLDLVTNDQANIAYGLIISEEHIPKPLTRGYPL